MKYFYQTSFVAMGLIFASCGSDKSETALPRTLGKENAEKKVQEMVKPGGEPGVLAQSEVVELGGKKFHTAWQENIQISSASFDPEFDGISLDSSYIVLEKENVVTVRSCSDNNSERPFRVVALEARAVINQGSFRTHSATAQTYFDIASLEDSNIKVIYDSGTDDAAGALAFAKKCIQMGLTLQIGASLGIEQLANGNLDITQYSLFDSPEVYHFTPLK